MFSKITRADAHVRISCAVSPLKLRALVGAWLIVALLCLLAPAKADAQLPPVTITTLNITSVPIPPSPTGQKIIQANLGVPVILTATVKTFSGNPVFTGTVVFCDGSVLVCLKGHALGSESLVVPTGPQNVGTAHLTITPTPGAHKYQAAFLGNGGVGMPPNNIYTQQPSQSTPYNFKVIGPYGPTATTLTSSGIPGNYTLNAKVTATGSKSVKPIGSVSFNDATNANFNLGSSPLGSTAFSFGFNGPVSPTPPQGFPLWFNQLSAVADVNNDGLPDLIMVTPDPNPANVGQYDIVVILNSITGFANVPSQIIPIPAAPSFPTIPTAITTADMNNDGNVDLLIAFDNESLFFYPGVGNQGAQANVYFVNSPNTLISPNGSYPYITSLVVGDLANTGFKSVFGTTTIGSFVLPNQGTPGGPSPVSFAPPQYTFSQTSTPSAIAVGDINGDGLTDFVIANFDTNDLTLFLQIGPGQFTQIPQTIPAGTAPSALTVADFNGDGILDIAVANMGDDNVNILLGNNLNNTGRNGSFTFTSKGKIATVPEPLFLTQGDFDGDGVIDLAVGNWDGLNITALVGKGDGTFKKSTLNGDSSLGLFAADLNFDGYSDLIGVGELLYDIDVYQSTWMATTSASLTGVAVAGTGTHQVNANYPGDTNYTGSTSNTVPLVAKPIATTLTLAGAPGSSKWTDQVTFTATLSPYSAQNHTTDGETIKFYDGNTFVNSTNLTLGKATLNISTLAVGIHNLKAVFAGDTNFATSTSSILKYTVGRAASTTVLTAASTVPKVGVADLLTATVTGFSAPRGNVTFTADGNTLCTAALGANGKATCSWIPWSTSVSHLVATYEGDNNYAASTGKLNLTASYTFNSKVVLTFSSTHLTFPGATNLKVCITRSTSATPTGTVQILDGNTVLQTLSLGGDGCAYWYINPGLSAGTHHIRALYSGGSGNPGGYSAITDVVVDKVASQWGIACWNSNFSYSTNQDFHCNVSVWSNAGSPPGSINYVYDNGATKSATLSNGNTSFIIPHPAIGSHTVVITYPGAANYTSLGPSTQSFTVTP
jgi:Bacterial Ig-like domain (group 3)/FG-GAP-like repeat